MQVLLGTIYWSKFIWDYSCLITTMDSNKKPNSKERTFKTVSRILQEFKKTTKKKEKEERQYIRRRVKVRSTNYKIQTLPSHWSSQRSIKEKKNGWFWAKLGKGEKRMVTSSLQKNLMEKKNRKRPFKFWQHQRPLKAQLLKSLHQKISFET